MSGFCEQDSAFGPQSQCRSFDFTVLFENAILSILPNAIALFLFSAYVGLSVSRKRIAGVCARRIDVLIAFALNVALNILTLIAWTTAESSGVPAIARSYLTAALALSIVISILHAVLVSSESSRRDSSFATSLYLLIILLLDVSRLRTLNSVGKASISEFFFIAFTASFTVRALCLILLNTPEPKQLGVHSSSGFFSNIFLLWLLPLMWKGRKRTLNLNDLPEFDQKSTALYLRFETSWRREQRKTHPNLLKALLRAFLPTFLSPVIPAILMALTQVVQPAMVNAAIQFINSYSSSSPEPVEWGWALAGMFAFIFLTLTCASTLYWYYIARTSAYIRGTMSEAVYRKTLALDVTCLASVPGGNPMNLISADIDRITSVIDPLHQMWSSLITIAIGLYLIYNELGAAFIATIVVTIVIMVATPYLSQEIRPLQTKLSAAGDRRIRLISGILRQIKGIKLSAHEPELIKKVSEVRKAELQARKNFWRKFYLIVCITSVTMNALSLATLGSYAIIAFLSHSEGLTTARLFTAYTAIGIITAPIYAIGQNYPRVLAAYACMKRLEGYLLSLESKSSPFAERFSVSTSDTEIKELTKDDMVSVQEIVYDEKMNISEPRVSGTVYFRSACIGWNDKTLLYDLNTEIHVGKITMVIGRVASGKSTFLHSLLDETQLLSGTITYPWKKGSIAYCSQTPWLQPSQSIRNNILFASEYEEVWYNEVIQACALELDLKKMKNGDSTLANGLSGGQKARVALARAVYSRKQVVILDDVFSALDGPTANSVFEALFSTGIGLLTRRTVILSTNKMAYLSSADWIISLDKSRLSGQGTYSDLRGVEPVLKEVEMATEDKSSPSGTVSGPKKLSFKMEELPSNTSSIATRSYMHYCRSAGWNCIAIYILLLLLTVGIQTITPVYLQVWSTYNDSHFSNRKSVVAYLPGYAAIEIAYTFALCYVFYYMIMILSQNASRNLHEWQFSAVMKAPMSFFDSTQVGQTINRFSQDIAYIDGGLPLTLYDFCYQMVRAIGGIIVMIVALPYMAAVVFGVVVVFYLVQWFYLATSKRVRRLDLASKTPLYTLYQETMEFNALLTIRAAGAEGHFLDSSEILLARSQRPFYLTRNVAAWLVSSIGVMTSIVNTSVVLLAIATRRSASAGLFAAAMSQAISLQDMLNTMLTSWTKLEMAAVSLERNLDLVNLPPEDDDSEGPGISDEQDKEWPSRGEIELINVMAKYRVTPILKDISFRAPAGSSLGICGRTGSGKSTVLLALLRVLHIEGQILIDGKSILDISRRRLRKSMSMVGQEPFLLDGTIRENLDITGCRSDDEVWAAIESAQLKQAISKLDGGIDHQIQSMSPALSPGQIQLLALARSLLSRRKIILLDEATAALDGETDDNIQKVIRSAFSDCTCITIAHRIKTIEDYDQVVVLDHGLVEEIGDPAELLQRKGSVFRELAQASEE